MEQEHGRFLPLPRWWQGEGQVPAAVAGANAAARRVQGEGEGARAPGAGQDQRIPRAWPVRRPSRPGRLRLHTSDVRSHGRARHAPRAAERATKARDTAAYLPARLARNAHPLQPGHRQPKTKHGPRRGRLRVLPPGARHIPRRTRRTGPLPLLLLRSPQRERVHQLAPSFVAERKRDTMGSLAPSLPTAGRPEEIPLPEDLPDDFPENAPEAAVEKQDPFVLGAMAVMPLLWGNEFWAEIEKRVETMEVGQEREEAVRRLRRPMLAVWGKEMCEALEGEGELVEGSPRPPMRCSVSEAMEKKLRVGLDVSTFLSLSPEVVARSLKAYHAQRFPSPFTPSSLLSAEMDPWMYSLAPDANDEPMHPLTRLVMLHVLVESRTCEERRAAVKGWAEVLGAGPGYAAAEAIRRAFGSAPVARLEDLAELVEGATFVEDDGRGVWRGGRKALKQLLEVTRKDEGRWGVREMKHVWDAVEKHWKSWTVEQSEDIGEDGDVGALVQFWEDQAGENDVTYQTPCH
ncbi:hypothetical protein CALVIDRAFT_310779 [Calocera viscosa TUFC12733]|uniref:Uncharacterized protein n=1 Tax=Calocera viscosa (strain TUFC12733) TaxID=1330018 RepID=A0A167I2C5_CALVF|nr:hypothetical protein CALVIDRAFT_310779 [Calocera viscosa TUFC12733]